MSVRDSLPTFSPPGVVDSDPVETGEWLDALEAVVRVSGHDRALALLRRRIILWLRYKPLRLTRHG